MRIAFFTDTFYPSINGVATSVMSMAVELGKKGHKVLIIAPRPRKKASKKFAAKNVELLYLRSVPALFYPEYRLGVPVLSSRLSAIRSFAPQIIHFHTPFSIGFDALLVAKMFHIPLVGTNHAYITKENAQSICVLPGMLYMEKQVASIALSYIDLFYNACDLRLVPSLFLQKQLRKGKKRKPYTYLPNGVPAIGGSTLSPAKKTALCKKYGLKERVILHVGRLSPEKSVDDVLKTFALLRKKRSDVSLLIIGDGPARIALEKLSKKLHVQDAVVFVGAIPHKELLSSGIVSVGDVFVTASAMENQPMVVLEAMSYGLPIVAVKEAGMVDLVKDNGFLVSAGATTAMAKKLETLLSDAPLRSAMGAHSREFARVNSVANVTDRLLELYEKLVLKRGQSQKE